MKHLFSIFSVLIFVIIAFGSIDEETSRDLEKKEKVLKINPDTKEGKMILDTIMNMNYNLLNGGYHYYIQNMGYTRYQYLLFSYIY